MIGTSWSSSNAPMRVKCIHRCLRACSCSAPVSSSSTAAMTSPRLVPAGDAGGDSSTLSTCVRRSVQATRAPRALASPAAAGEPCSAISGCDPGGIPDDGGRPFPRLRPCDSTPTAPPPSSTGSTAPPILITKDPHEAEDLVQDTYELILRRPRELKGDSELHYMRAAMRRRHVDRHRESSRRVAAGRARRRARGPRAAVGEEPRCAPSRPRCSPRSARCPEIHRDVLVATYVAGLTYSEAACVLGVKRGTVMSRVFRAREALVSRSPACAAVRRRAGTAGSGAAERAGWCRPRADCAFGGFARVLNVGACRARQRQHHRLPPGR